MSGFAGYISNVGNIDEMAKFISQNGNAVAKVAPYAHSLMRDVPHGRLFSYQMLGKVHR